MSLASNNVKQKKNNIISNNKLKYMNLFATVTRRSRLSHGTQVYCLTHIRGVLEYKQHLTRSDDSTERQLIRLKHRLMIAFKKNGSSKSRTPVT